MIKLVAQAKLPTEFGVFDIHIFKNSIGCGEPVVLTMGDFLTGKSILCRVHSECMTGEVFHSIKCDCHAQLMLAMKKIAKIKQGIIIYLRQEGRGIGLVNKIKAYRLEDLGYDTVDANLELGLPVDNRQYDLAIKILQYFGIKQINLMTNNPDKISAFNRSKIKVIKRVPVEIKPSRLNKNYLQTKKRRLGHLLKNV